MLERRFLLSADPHPCSYEQQLAADAADLEVALEPVREVTAVSVAEIETTVGRFEVAIDSLSNYLTHGNFTEATAVDYFQTLNVALTDLTSLDPADISDDMLGRVSSSAETFMAAMASQPMLPDPGPGGTSGGEADPPPPSGPPPLPDTVTDPDASPDERRQALLDWLADVLAWASDRLKEID